MKHIIVSRVNIPRELDPSNHVRPAPYKREEWNRRRVELLNKFTRPSLRQQTCQDFELVTLWGPQYKIDRANELPNERQFIVRRGLDPFDEKAFDFVQWREDPRKCEKYEMDFAFQIRDLFRRRYEAPVLFTNLDSDDCLRYDFVENVQRHAKHIWQAGKAPCIIDIKKRYCMHVGTGGQGQKVRNTPSPATSSLETKIECYPLRWHHSMMLDYLPEGIGFEQYEDLLIMQTVSDTNILTQGTGDDGHFNPKDYF